MRIKVLTSGDIFEAKSFEGVVNLMRRGSFNQEPNVATFMTKMAERAEFFITDVDLDGLGTRHIRSDTAENFIRDHIAVGLMEVIDEND